ncbi:MAG: glycoside hydrolase family 99-like domain-containing protein [Chryseolinea sp.]
MFHQPVKPLTTIKIISMNQMRPIAIYLPQFHPIRENDEWWGKGFTEWRNVIKGKPRFKGHYQPQLPADLGYYDLRLPETRQAQADLAKQYGIHGFCYYHYWFNGKRILERPFQEVFESGSPDFPFMLCWANENWTRIWDGGENSVLLKQDYSFEDDAKHINALIPYFKDKRYIKVNGKPVFAIYKDALFPNINRTIEIFKEECAKHGLELYICKFERDIDSAAGDPIDLGFDASIEFQPLSKSRREFIDIEQKKFSNRYLRISKYVTFIKKRLLRQNIEVDKITDLEKFVEYDIQRPRPPYKIFPGVSPSWDNSSRRPGKRANIFINSSPKVFQKWVRNKVSKFPSYSKEENFLFVNAWNEWAEGNHLEPCERYGHQYLQALKDGIIEGSSDRSGLTP